MRSPPSRVSRYRPCEPFAEIRILYAGGVRIHFNLHLWFGGLAVSGQSGGVCGRRDLTYAKDDLLDRLRAGDFVQFVEERRLQERELLKPNGVSDDQMKFLETNMGRPGLRRDWFSDDVRPVML